MPDWDKIGKALNFNLQLSITAEVFFESWFAFAHDCLPSWNQLARALERADTSKYRQAAAYVWKKEGMNQYDLYNRNYERISNWMSLSITEIWNGMVAWDMEWNSKCTVTANSFN